MISQKSEFRLFDRGFKDTLLLIPGWASDYRIFTSLDLGFNYLMPVKFSPFDFKKGLIDSLHENKLSKISIFGWSMGSFLAQELISEYPDKIDSPVFMVSARIRYEKETIKEIAAYLKKNKAGYLYKFYHECFSMNEKEGLSWFKKNLLKSYLDEMDPALLVDGLEYILSANLDPQVLKNLEIKFIHGEEDRIAPIREALEMRKSLPGSELIPMKGVGHMPFLNPDFKKIFYGGHGE